MRFWLMLGGAVFLTPVCSAQEVTQPGLSLAAKVEIWRHSRLEAVRAREDSVLQPFATDGCSGGMSAAWQALADTFPKFYEVFEEQAPWHECCVVHDRAYHLGGADPTPDAGYWARLKADEDLRLCVQQVAENDSTSLADRYDQAPETVEAAINFVSYRMFDAVRVGGLPCSGLSWRWGYGWPQCW